MGALLSTQQLVFGRSGEALSEPVDLTVTSGQVMAILGANGSGKTTFLQTLLGIIAPLSGQIYVAGQPLKQYSNQRRAQLMAYVPQAHGSHFSFSVLEMVLMGRTAHLPLLRRPNHQDTQIAQSALEQLEIGHLAERPYPQISGGEQQLVLIARALTQQTQVLIMDEPTSSLDFANQIRVLEQLSKLRQQGLAIVLSTHQPEHALKIANRLALFKRGDMVTFCDAETFTQPEQLADLYDVSPQQVHDYLLKPSWGFER